MIDFIRVQNALDNIARLIQVPSEIQHGEEYYRYEIAAKVLSRVTIQWREHIHGSITVGTDREHGVRAMETAESLYNMYCDNIGLMPFPSEIIFSKLGFDRTELIKVLDEAGAQHSLVKPTTNQAGEAPQPWFIADQRDPTPKHTWYIAARYFAREIVKDNPKLSVNRNLITPRIKQRLIDVGIYKRGGKPYEADTINNALKNMRGY